jgi:CubicO group peptidase (beta-lactamase class C family)
MKRLLYPILFLVLVTDYYNGKAQTYTGTQDGKFLRDWYLAGPVNISNDPSKKPGITLQQEFFNRTDNQNQHVSFKTPDTGKSFDLKNWKKISSKADIIDLDSIFNHADMASAYAYAVVVSNEAKPAMLAIGSDDAVKVWLNGKLIHKNWIARGTVQDNDIIPVNLVKGKNEILVEVQDMEGGWSFTARFLDEEGLTKRLTKAAGTGDIDELSRLISAGAGLNRRTDRGQTPLDAARINGRTEAAQLLISKGAKNEDVPAADQLVNSLYSQLENKPNPGIAILISKDGKVVYEKGYGYSDIDNKTKITPDTKFRIGSITKQFIASAILRLQEDGKLNVTDKLSKYFPDFPRGNEVTLHHLLTHTSGIHSFTNKDSFFVDVVKPVTNEQLLNYFKNDPYDFNPGERYQYNNSGYFLLGYIIEKITGDSYGNYLKKQFFDPLGMLNTGVHSQKLHLTNEALGYEKQTEGYRRGLNWNMDWAGGAGSLYSTLEDLYKWNEAIFNNKVLKPESMKAAFTPVVLNNGATPPGLKYGYGWQMNEYRGMESVSHSGGLHGFISQLLRVNKENMTVVMLTNVMPPQVEIDPMKVAELYLWKQMPQQESFKQLETQEKDIDKYTGRYDFGHGMVMLITKEQDGLYAQMSGQGKFPIFPSSPGHYFWKVVEAKIHFITDAQGNVTQSHFEQGSFIVDAPKMKDLQEFKVDTALFEQYKGVYKYKEGTNIVITPRNGRLYAEATGDPRYELFPLSDTEFLVRELNATLIFKKDASGKVNALHVKVAGDARDAPRVE